DRARPRRPARSSAAVRGSRSVARCWACRSRVLLGVVSTAGGLGQTEDLTAVDVDDVARGPPGGGRGEPADPSGHVVDMTHPAERDAPREVAVAGLEVVEVGGVDRGVDRAGRDAVDA